MDGKHAAEIAIIRAQRDALADVVRLAWDNAREGLASDPGTVAAWLVQAGLVEDAAGVLRLSVFGAVAMAGRR